MKKMFFEADRRIFLSRFAHVELKTTVAMFKKNCENYLLISLLASTHISFPYTLTI